MNSDGKRIILQESYYSKKTVCTYLLATFCVFSELEMYKRMSQMLLKVLLNCSETY